MCFTKITYFTTEEIAYAEWWGMAGLTQQPSSEDALFGKEAGPNSGKSEREDCSAGASPLCPQCGSKKLWRDALRYTDFGDKIQRWLCRECGLRFSDPNDVKNAWSTKEKATRISSANEIKSKRRHSFYSPNMRHGDEKLGCRTSEQLKFCGETKLTMSKEKSSNMLGGSKKTEKATQQSEAEQKSYKILTKRGANLYDPESIKDAIAKQPWSNGRKNNAVRRLLIIPKNGRAARGKHHYTKQFARYPSFQKKQKSISS